MSDSRPNLVLITADDMNWDAVGAFGCPVPGTTPNIDRLAREGIRFTHGHVTIAVCQPSRSAMMTGLYPHNSGGEGFFRVRNGGLPILPDLLRKAGYDVGILGKVPHSTPYEDFGWDMSHDLIELGTGRNPSVYKRFAGEFIRRVTHETDSGSPRPFFLMFNSHDPHRPFYGNDAAEWYEQRDPPAAIPSRVFTPEEITVPGFLEELPEVRLEISEYYSSVRRCDDSVGGLLDALDEAGVADNTLILFLSDNGMAFPYAKTNCYLNSTRTPWIMRWPAVIGPDGPVEAGAVDDDHFVSGIDIMPTFLEAAGVDVNQSKNIDGRSFLDILRGGEGNGRSMVVTHFHQTAMKRNYPMRCIQDARFGYIFNPWSDGERVFENESQSGRTFAAMKAAAEVDPAIRQRVEFFLHRVVEEFYDFRGDPNARTNLIGDRRYKAEVDRLRTALEGNMRAHGDPLLEVFLHRDDPAWRERGMDEITALLGGR